MNKAEINLDSAEKFIERLAGSNFKEFKTIATQQSKLLEFSAYLGVKAHYENYGYEAMVIHNTKTKNFKIKTNTKGYSINFSRYQLSKGDYIIEIHMNLSVRSAHDEGIYCVDVAVINRKGIQEVIDKKECVSNKNLITFVEVKKLIIYPMLLAQFYGIVHEIKPSFCSGKLPHNYKKFYHFNPSLIALGYLTSNSSQIVKAYKSRSIKINIVDNFDIVIMNYRKNRNISPIQNIKN
ncbi:hypothetical protein [Leptospira bandrabouensis]|uniref:hypothetical protein n=1 Tax=Leptospira bandrabouensis TaxID=2484903 RepID=UPI001EEB3D39|nr:hypothetical protein [Leptospira bandrabouensis]MCG6146633.1 hypothetical protein [Leptospira bandrabouensis]MCG6166229.1 hypothetical protein [Leptospira bandrabouensis]